MSENKTIFGDIQVGPNIERLMRIHRQNLLEALKERLEEFGNITIEELIAKIEKELNS